MDEILGRIGNDVVTMVATSKNLASDYKKLLEFLAKLEGMKPDERMTVRDRVILEVRDKEGNLKDSYDSGWSPNGLTNAGFAEVAGLILTDVTTGIADFDYIAIGTGTTAFDPTQTALVTETHREAAVGTRVTTTVTDDTAQLVHTFTGYTGSESVTESGVFNAATAGDMLCRQVFTALAIDWDAGDSLQVTWKIQCKQGA